MAKPYTRVKRGKLEKVTGYVSRIAPNRSMQQYFKEVGEESLLTHDQTAKLARKYKKGNKAAGDQLVRANLKLVAKVANQYARYGIPVQDLIQEGNIGLMAAAKKYNPKKAQFSTYAWQWAEAYIRRYAKQRLEHIGVEGPLPGPEEKQLVSKLATPEQAYQIKEEAQQRTAKIESAIQKLNPKEQFIIRSRILSEDPITLEEISSRLDLSKQRISQMEKTALAKLKHYMTGGDKMNKGDVLTIDEALEKAGKKGMKWKQKRQPTGYDMMSDSSLKEHHSKVTMGGKKADPELQREMHDRFQKADTEPKLTKDEAREWLNLKIRRQAKEKIRYPEKDKIPTLADIANCIYENLVEEWTYNNKVLNACRAVKCDQVYIMDLISSFFDDKGQPKDLPKNSINDGPKVAESPSDVRTSSSPMAGMPYYASMVTIDEEFEKARKKGSKDLKPRKQRYDFRTKTMVDEPSGPSKSDKLLARQFGRFLSSKGEKGKK